jgi:hypothetical protein
VLFSTRQVENDGNVLQSENRRRQTYSAVKVPGYCGQCNNGWMSQTESRVIPLVTAMMRGERVGFSKDDVAALSLWLCIKTLVADSEDHGYVTFTASDFRWVYEHRTVPEQFMARIGRFDHPNRTRCQFQVAPIQAAHELGGMKINEPLAVELNLSLGEVWFQCAMFRLEARDYPLPKDTGPISPFWTVLWPNPGTNVNWPPPYRFTGAQLPQNVRDWPEADAWLQRKGLKWADTRNRNRDS